jgi:AraC family transcriptional regulator
MFEINDWQCAGHDSPGNREEWQADNCIVFTRRGVWELRERGNINLADPLHVMLWNGQSEFKVRHPIGGNDDCTVIRLTAEGSAALRDIHAPSAQSKIFQRTAHLLTAQQFYRHLQLLHTAQQFADTNQIEQMGIDLIMEVCDTQIDNPEQAAPSKVPVYLQHARELIAKNYTNSLTLAQIANAVSCSPFHLARQFKRTFKISVHQAILSWRLREGLRRVLDQPEQLTMIAADLGFASHSHFTDAFRATFGCAPQQARHKKLHRVT